MPEPLITRHRPVDLDEFYGNKAIKKVIIKCILDENKRAQTYLLRGMRGCGKTTLAWLMSYHFGAKESGIIEVDCGQDRSIDTFRRLGSMVNIPPMEGNAKCFIIDEVHTLLNTKTAPVQDSLLKMTEHPPPNVYFFLCSTDPEKIAGTLKSRCLPLEVKPLSTAEAMKFLKYIDYIEGIGFSRKFLNEIIKTSNGIPRDILTAISLVRDIEGIEEVKELLQMPRDEEPEVIDLLRNVAFGKGNTVKIIKAVENFDIEKTRRAVLTYLTKCILNSKDGKEVAHWLDKIELFSDPFYNGQSDLVYAVLRSVML